MLHYIGFADVYSMTRMCRAQFELDDIAEADIVCQRRFRPSSSEPETDPDNVEQHTLCVNNERAPKSTAHRHAQW